MILSIYSMLIRLARLPAPLCLVMSTFAISQAHGQEESGRDLPAVSYSYITESDAARQYFDLGVLSKLPVIQELNFEALSALEAKTVEELDGLRANSLVQGLLENSATRPLGEGLLLGGMSSAAAIAILNVTSIGTAKCQALGKEPYGTPILGSSSMRAVQHAIDVNTGKGLGRGEFDIQTTKFVLCRDPMTNTFEGVPINVRWVFNVNGDSLKTETGNLTGPNGKPYKQNFHAEGLGIQLVLMQIDGEELQPNNPIYLVVEDACIDIWFVNEVDGFDIWVPTSMIGNGVFCAGGYCKDDPPGLDATQ